MQLDIKLEGVDKVIRNLQDIPNGAKWVISQSIKEALGKGRTEMDRAIRSRYGVRQQAVLSAIGRPYISGLWGIIQSGGKRLRTQDFLQSQDQAPDGVAIQFIKGRTVVFPRAFQHGKSAPILERIGASRYPLHSIVAPFSVPEALEQKKDVLPKVQASVETSLNSEMDRLMRLVLGGQVYPGRRR